MSETIDLFYPVVREPETFGKGLGPFPPFAKSMVAKVTSWQDIVRGILSLLQWKERGPATIGPYECTRMGYRDDFVARSAWRVLPTMR